MVLALTERRGAIDYHQLSSETGMPDAYAADRLTRYARAGLLSRDREGDGGLSRFRLTPKGTRRLRYFRNQSR